jgi:hypothetical protein
MAFRDRAGETADQSPSCRFQLGWLERTDAWLQISSVTDCHIIMLERDAHEVLILPKTVT